MRKNTIVQTMSFLSVGVGLVVIAGWIFDVQLFKSLHPSWVTMKFTTAVAFVLSGLILYFVAHAGRGKEAVTQVVLPALVLTLLLIMVTLLSSSLIGVRTGLEDLFVREAEGAVKTSVPGRPSMGTMVNFVLIGLTGIFAMLKPAHLRAILRILGATIGIIGAVGTLGYLVNAPFLYYSVPGVSTAMALHTAILFTLLGVGFFLYE